jgi:hypothetical protein
MERKAEVLKRNGERSGKKTEEERKWRESVKYLFTVNAEGGKE